MFYFWKPLNARKYHVFDENGVSLCNKWMDFAHFDGQSTDDRCVVKGTEIENGDDCQICFALLLKKREEGDR